MSVVIHDFEIIPDAPDENPDSDETGGEPASGTTALRPADVVEIVDREERRRRRLRAH
jgi:hypothetical protein